MIGRLRGELLAKQPPHLLLEVGGIGYELEAPMSTFYALPPLGEQAVLFTHLLVREDAQILYAFINESERSLFRALLRVSGIGAKMALAILSGMDVQAFACCVQTGDTDSLVRLPGIGRKTAERLIVEMRDRLDTQQDAVTAGLPRSANAQSTTISPVDEALQALVSLGYKLQEAQRLVRRVNTQDLSSEEIIRQALQASLK